MEVKKEKVKRVRNVLTITTFVDIFWNLCEKMSFFHFLKLEKS